MRTVLGARRRHAALTLGVLLTPAFLSSAGAQTTVPRAKLNRPGTGELPYSIFRICETSPNRFRTTDPTRNSDAFAIAPRPIPQSDGTSVLCAAGLSSGFFDNTNMTGGFARFDEIIGALIGIDPASPNQISVTCNTVVSTGDETCAVRSIGLGSVTDAGLVSFRYDNGATLPHGIASKSLLDDSSTTALFCNSFSAPDSGTASVLTVSNGSNLTLPSTGSNGLTFFTTFDRQLGVAREDLTPAAGLEPHGQILNTLVDPDDNRGSAAYNATAGLVAAERYMVVGSSGVVTGVAVYQPVDNGDGTVSLFGVAVLPFPDTPDSMVPLRGANYFGRTSFAGPRQIAMNDNGDLAVVTVATAGNSSTDVENAERKVYLFNKYDAANGLYLGWQVVADSNARSSGIVTQNPVNAMNPLGVGSPALDNNGNIYYSATYEITTDGTARSRRALYRAVPNDPANPTSWTPTQILREGDTWTVGADTYTVTFLPVQVTTDLSNTNVRRVGQDSLGPDAVRMDANGLIVAARVAKNSDVPRWTYLYWTP